MEIAPQNYRSDRRAHAKKNASLPPGIPVLLALCSPPPIHDRRCFPATPRKSHPMAYDRE